MADDPRAQDRERYDRKVWTRREREEFSEVVRLRLSPADDLGEIPPERGPFLYFGEWLETQDEETRQRARRAFPGGKLA
jgi:hypothetical protein